MRALTIRNEIVESIDEIDGAAVDADGRVVATWGDPRRIVLYRSAIKPIQAAVSQEHGADLSPEHLAVAAASHSGYPIHLAIVRAILRDGGLDERDLDCTPGWPLESAARDLVVAAGHRRPRRIFHNCSGKHATFLRACVAAGWPTAGYLSPDHPLQRRILRRVADVAGVDAEPAAVDGCGAPAPRGTLEGLARTFSHLTADPAYRDVAVAMSRFGALVSGTHRPDADPCRWWGGPVKVGAEGVIAAGRHGLGLAVKSRSGNRVTAVVGLVEAMRLLAVLSPAQEAALAHVARPAVLGHGEPQGIVSPDTDEN